MEDGVRHLKQETGVEEKGVAGRVGLQRGERDERVYEPLASSCFWYCLIAMKPAPAARTS